MNKSLLARSFLAGAVSVSLLAWAAMWVALQMTASAISAQGGGYPVTILSNPFLDLKTPSGGTVSVGGAWFWVIAALVGGTTFSLVAGVVSTVSNKAKKL